MRIYENNGFDDVGKSSAYLYDRDIWNRFWFEHDIIASKSVDQKDAYFTKTGEALRALDPYWGSLVDWKDPKQARNLAPEIPVRHIRPVRPVAKEDAKDAKSAGGCNYF